MDLVHSRSVYSEPHRRVSRNELIVGKKFDSNSDFQKPTVVGHFCLDSDRNYLPNASLLKYLYFKEEADVNFDLNDGLSKHIAKDEYLNEKLDHIFCWLHRNKYTEELSTIDFVCFRGLLTKIMCTPYEDKEAWIICAKRLHNTIFLCEFETEEKKREKENASDKMKTFTAWGYKFEQYMLSEKPGMKPDTSQPVIESEEMCCVFKSKLNGHRIIYAAEMDGIMNNESVNPDTDWHCLNSVSFIELKTNRIIDHYRQDTNFRKHKLRKWWCQSYLVGIETIICGFRNDAGRVESLKHYRVRDLPKMAKGLWDPWVCLNFCAEFLDFVKRIVDKSNDLWKFTWSPGRSVRSEEISGSSQYSFIPNQYETSCK